MYILDRNRIMEKVMKAILAVADRVCVDELDEEVLNAIVSIFFSSNFK